MKLLARIANVFCKCFRPRQNDQDGDQSAAYLKRPSPDTDIFEEGEDCRAPGTIPNREIDVGRGLVSNEEKIVQNKYVDQFQSLRESLKPPTGNAGLMGGLTIPFGSANGATGISSFTVPAVFAASPGVNIMYDRPVIDAFDRLSFEKWNENKMRDAGVICADTKSSRIFGKPPARSAGRMGGLTIPFGSANGATGISSFTVPAVFAASPGANMYDRPVIDSFDRPSFQKWNEKKMRDASVICADTRSPRIFEKVPARIAGSLNLAVTQEQLLTSEG